jgi:hypothetical protein
MEKVAYYMILFLTSPENDQYTTAVDVYLLYFTACMHRTHLLLPFFTSALHQTLQPDSSNSKAELFVVDLEGNETAPAKWRVTPPAELTDRY